jgi:mannose-6-phosphate isomerase-like protein (cupin superfamily)
MSHKTLCGAIQSKFWGTTQCVYAGPYAEAHYLVINKGGYCSKHEHVYKWNRFFLISGKLKVIIYRKDDKEDCTILEAGHFTDVPPGSYHKFEALEDCVCLEIYWVENIDIHDIERLTIGGVSVNNHNPREDK